MIGFVEVGVFEAARLTLIDVDPADYLYTAASFAIEFGEALLPWEFAALPNNV